MATISIIRVENPAEKAEISAHILHALPDWFGLPDSTQKYIDDSRNMPFFAAVQENQAVGFAALKETSLFTLAGRAGIAPPEAFVERFIAYDREVRSHGRHDGA